MRVFTTITSIASSLEARLVKAADVLDLLVQVLALERAGARGLGRVLGSC